MKRSAVIICSALIGLAGLSPQAFAKQKTVKVCQDEWRAGKAENQAKGITESAYVTQCRAASAAPDTTKSVPSAATEQKVTAPDSAAGSTKAVTKSAPSAATDQKVAAPDSATRQNKVVTTTPTQANQFSTEALAKARCPAETVVWVNLSSRIYHFAGNKDYGKTKRGAYMCEKDTVAAKFRPAKNEKHPS